MTAIGRAGSGFVGRESELAELEAALGDAVEGRGRLVLISGEPGIGKSRLAAELVRQAQARGIVVLSGRCWEAGGAPPYWPWVQALRPLVRELPAHRLASHLGEGGPDVAQMLPEIRSALPDLAEPPSLDSDAARFQLFDSTAQFLLRAARDEPMVLVLDDLHSADVPSLLLLRFVAPELSRAHVLVVATWRTGEMGIEHPLAEAVADVLRLPATRRLELAGFSERDVAAFVESTAGVTPSPQQVAAIRGETEGNPLFVQEVVRLLASEGMLEQVGRGTSLPAIPQGVREVIGRRLLHISDECTRVLTLAAVLGREFTLEALRRMSELAADDLLEVLEEAVSARVVEDVPGSLGWLRFSHVLIRDVLYEDVSGTQRLRLHRRAGTVLEELYRADPTPHLAELAHHFAQAAPAGEWAKAVEYARRAGDQAVDQLAYEEAVRVYGIALQALDLEPSAEEETRCDLLLALGDAQARAGGLGARETFVAAADLAQRLGRPQALAKAALGYGGRFTWSRAAGDARIVPLLEAARAALGERDDPLLVQVLGRLSCALRDRHEREPRWTLSRLAVAMARRIDDPHSLSYALSARWGATWEPDNAEERLALADEALALAERAGDKERLQEAHLMRSTCFFEMGRTGEVRAELDVMERLAQEIRQAPQTWLANANRTLLLFFEGRFADAERLADQTFRAGEGAVAHDALSHQRFHAFAHRRERGGLDEIEPMIREAAHRFTWYPMFRCALAVLHLQAGRRADAERELRLLAADDFAVLPYDNEWLLGMSLVAELIEGLGAVEVAPRAFERLLPHAHRNAVGLAEGCAGSVARYLGLLAMTSGELSEAVRRLEDAVAMNRAMGARPWVAHAQHDLARALLARDGPADRERAEVVLTEALAICEDVGMPVLAEEIRSVAEVGAPAAPATAPAAGGAAPATFRRDGDYFSIAFEGDAFRLKDAKGLRYLGRLLANPGRELHALDVAAEGAERSRPGRVGGDLVAGGTGGTGPILDATAKAAYRERLAELEREADDARALGDDERAARAEAERDALVQQLSAAAGLGGRDRETGSAAERARVNVTRSIKAAQARIARESPALGAHLERTIRTGTFCSYSPDPRAPVAWRL